MICVHLALLAAECNFCPRSTVMLLSRFLILLYRWVKLADVGAEGVPGHKETLHPLNTNLGSVSVSWRPGNALGIELLWSMWQTSTFWKAVTWVGALEFLFSLKCLFTCSYFHQLSLQLLHSVLQHRHLLNYLRLQDKYLHKLKLLYLHLVRLLQQPQQLPR